MNRVEIYIHQSAKRMVFKWNLYKGFFFLAEDSSSMMGVGEVEEMALCKCVESYLVTVGVYFVA